MAIVRKYAATPRPPRFINWNVAVFMVIGYTAAGFAALSLNHESNQAAPEQSVAAAPVTDNVPQKQVATARAADGVPQKQTEKLTENKTVTVSSADYDQIETRLTQRPVQNVGVEKVAKAPEPQQAEVSVTQQSSSEKQGPSAAGNNKKVVSVKIQASMLKAVDTGDIDGLLQAAEQGAGVDSLLESGETALMRAAWNGDKKMVTALIKAGAKPNFYSARGQTALLYAAIRGKYTVIESLLEGGARINQATPDGKTPLMAAAWNKQPRVVELLISKGARINRSDRAKRTALYYAISVGNVEAASALVAAGADKNRTDVAGISISQLAEEKSVDLEAL
jgi:hypothetical protein